MATNGPGTPDGDSFVNTADRKFAAQAIALFDSLVVHAEWTHDDAVQELVAALHAYVKQRSAWQPIETAPSAAEYPDMDVLVYSEYQGVNIRATDGEWWRGQQSSFAPARLTHWMPLPAPPKEVK